jgi:hypothetical protein
MFIEILRENMNIPQSPMEIELDRLAAIEEAKLEKLRIEEQMVINEEQQKSAESICLKVEIWKEFKKKFEIPLEYTMENFFKEVPEAQEHFENFVNEQQRDGGEDEYFDIDEGDF